MAEAEEAIRETEAERDELAERLDALVDDLLILSDIESKEITLKKENFNLKEQLSKVILGFRSQIRGRGIEIKDELPPDITVNADGSIDGKITVGNEITID